MIPRFSLARPKTLTAALDAFVATDGEGAYIAGGTELLQVMKMGFAQFATLVDLKAIPDLRGITVSDGYLRIGAATTHREVERSPIVREAIPGLVELERQVANVRVRSTGTIGGNLAFAEPHSDPATFLLCCGAVVDLQGTAGIRSLPIGEFVVGPLWTAREPDEILTAIRIPSAAAGEGRAYGKFAFFERPAASVAVRLLVDGGRIRGATVTVGSLTEVPTVVEEAGSVLTDIAATSAALATALPEAVAAFARLDAVEDLNGSADYKRHLAGVLLGSTAQAALSEALARA